MMQLSTDNLLGRGLCSLFFAFPLVTTPIHRESMMSILLLWVCLTGISSLDLNQNGASAVEIWNGNKNLTVVALLPMTGAWPGGQAMLTAMQMALDNINSREDILPGYNLNIVYNDTQFKVYEGIHVLHNFIEQPPVKMAVLGAANSELSQAAATFSELFNLVTVSYASVTPLLSDKMTYPYFFRLSAPDTVVNPARIAFMKLFGWTRAAAITQSRTVFDAVIQDLKERFERENFLLLASEVFTDSPAAQIHNLKKIDARIIFAECNKDKAVKVFCEAYKAGLYGPKFVWLLPGWFDEGWWRTTDGHGCSIEQMEKVAEGYFSPGDLVRNPNTQPGISGIISSQYDEMFDEKTNFSRPFATTLSTQGYDAIWAIALALNATDNELKDDGRSLTDFNYDEEIGQMIHHNMKRAVFEGVKAPIEFDKNQDPIILVKLQRVQKGKFQTVAIYRPDSENVQENWQWLNDTPLIWQDGKAPADATTVLLRQTFVATETYVTVVTLASVFILIAVTFLVINFASRETRVIKMSSPNINNVILLGCIFFYITVFLQERTLAQVSLFCKLRTFTVALGYSLAFGGLFSKTWRIHVIFANKQLKKKVVKDSKLMCMVVILILIDLIILITWITVDPTYVRNYNTTVEELPEGDTVLQHQLAVCESKYNTYFTWTLLVVKGLLMLFGAFLAWETRNVKIPALNDSKLIGMCIYNTVILAVVIAILTLAITNNVQLEYLIVSLFYIMGATLTQFIIFVPKLMKLRELRINPEADQEYTKGKGVQDSATNNTATSAGNQDRVKDLEGRLQEAMDALAKLQNESHNKTGIETISERVSQEEDDG